MILGICGLDSNGQVVMRDGSVLPQAEGEGRITKVVQDQEANRTAITMELDVLPDMDKIESEALIAGPGNYADSLDYGHSSSYEYMNNIKEVEDFTGMEVKERPEEHQDWSQLKEELGTLPSSLDIHRERM